MLVRKYKEDAEKWLEFSEVKYRGHPVDFVPRRIARRWCEAFTGGEADLDAMAQILRDVEPDRNRYGLTFHAFCNDMRRMYLELWQDFLEKRLSDAFAPGSVEGGGG